VSEPSEIHVNLPFRGPQLAEFLAIKEYLGIHTNADVVRYLVHWHARALKQQAKGSVVLPPRRQETKTQRGDAKAAAEKRSSVREGDVRGGAKTPSHQAGGAPELICLECPLPECDEGDPRCPYQQATGERERQRGRIRTYMRRARAK
jgi:hypothetical protein